MASIGGITIADRAASTAAGAAFLLIAPSNVSENIPLQSGAYVEVRTGVGLVVVRFNSAEPPEGLFHLGHEFAQEGLDLLSIRGKADLIIREAGEEHTLWWCDAGKRVIRQVSTLTLNFDVPPVNIVALDEKRQPIPSEVRPTDYHHGFRYFRLSQVTEDIYDSYRNMYLAFELLLSSRYPMSHEREIDWLNRALAQSSVELNLPALTRCTNATDAISTIIKTTYYDARLPLFHAKHGRQFYPPQAQQNREKVSKALSLLTQIVLRMSEVWYNARRPGGFVFHHWVHQGIIQQFSNARMLASDDQAPLDPSQSDLSHPRYESAVFFDMRHAPEIVGTAGPAFLGSVDGQQISRLPRVARIEIVEKDYPIAVQILENELRVDDIDRFEAQFNTRVNNVRPPKSLFKL